MASAWHRLAPVTDMVVRMGCASHTALDDAPTVAMAGLRRLPKLQYNMASHWVALENLRREKNRMPKG